MTGPDLHPPPLSAGDKAAIRESVTERAYIIEFYAGASRQVAEEQAQSAMAVFRFTLTDDPSRWLTCLAPGCDLADAIHSLELRLGDRLIEVLEQGRTDS